MSLWKFTMKAVVAERGQVPIPKALRDKLGIRVGTTLELAAKNGMLIAHKAETDPESKVFGCLGAKIDTDRVIRDLRDDAGK